MALVLVMGEKMVEQTTEQTTQVDKVEEELPRRRTVKICHVKDMWYVFVPKFVERLLAERNISVGDRAVWEVESVDSNKIVCRITFSK